MSKKFTIAFIVTAISAAAIATYLLSRNKSKKMLDTIAEEGYETATDVLYHGKKIGDKQHYGPVIPS